MDKPYVEIIENGEVVWTAPIFYMQNRLVETDTQEVVQEYLRSAVKIYTIAETDRLFCAVVQKDEYVLILKALIIQSLENSNEQSVEIEITTLFGDEIYSFESGPDKKLKLELTFHSCIF